MSRRQCTTEMRCRLVCMRTLSSSAGVVTTHVAAPATVPEMKICSRAALGGGGGGGEQSLSKKENTGVLAGAGMTFYMAVRGRPGLEELPAPAPPFAASAGSVTTVTRSRTSVSVRGVSLCGWR